jgi:hypothetical protein
MENLSVNSVARELEHVKMKVEAEGSISLGYETGLGLSSYST